jgi:hypothetical protein
MFTGHEMGSSRSRPFSSHEAKAVEVVANAVNGLPVAEPVNTGFSCPAGDGELYVWLTFREVRDGPLLALVQVDPYGCGRATAWITVPGRRRLALTGSGSLLGVVEKAVGSRLEGLPGGS